jgi:SAM-dependent methyltransferase
MSNLPRAWSASEACDYCRGRKPSAVDELVLSRLAGSRLILEVGCGPGMLQRSSGTAILAETDSCMGFLRHARSGSMGRSLFACADVCFLPFRPRSFDAAVAMAVLHGLDDFSLEKALAGCRSVLAEGGRLVVAEDWAFSDPSPAEAAALALRFHRPEDAEHHRGSGDWCRLLERAGFEILWTGWARRPFDPHSTPAGREGQLDPDVLVRLPVSPEVRMLVIEGARR